MITILANVKDKIITSDFNQKIVCDNTDYQIKFTFDEEWNSYPVKTVRFTYLNYNGEQKIIDVVCDSDTCLIPKLSNLEYVEVGVYAGDLHTTAPLFINCRNSILSKSGTPDEPPKDVYAEIMDICNESVTIAKSIEARANSGEFKGADGKDGVNGRDGVNGKDYVLSAKDKQDIADLILEPLKQDLRDVIAIQEEILGDSV